MSLRLATDQPGAPDNGKIAAGACMLLPCNGSRSGNSCPGIQKCHTGSTPWLKRLPLFLRRKPAAQSMNAQQVENRMEAIPGPLASALLPFQQEGVRWSIAHAGRVLIADEMGVGKTVQAIALASAYQVCIQVS